MGWNASNNDAAARFKQTREKLGVTSVEYYSELNIVPKWGTYIEWSVPLVSATDWLNSQSADRLNIRSADWPALAQVATSHRQTSQHYKNHQRPHRSYNEPIHNVHPYKQQTIQHTRTAINSSNMRSPATNAYTELQRNAFQMCHSFIITQSYFRAAWPQWFLPPARFW